MYVWYTRKINLNPTMNHTNSVPVFKTNSLCSFVSCRTVLPIPCAHLYSTPTAVPIPCAHLYSTPTAVPIPCAHLYSTPTAVPEAWRSLGWIYCHYGWGKNGSLWPVSLWSLAGCDCVFESQRLGGCLVCCEYCQVEVSSTGWSLFQMSYMEGGVLEPVRETP